MADRRRRNEAIRRRQEHYKPSQREDQERWEREEMRREERMREILRTLRDAWEAYCKEQEQMRYRHRYCRCSSFGRSIPEWIESHNYALEERQSEEERRFLNQRYKNMKDFLLRTLRGLPTLTDSVQRSELEKYLTEIMAVINDFYTIKTVRFAVFPNVNLHNFHCISLSDKDLDVMFIAKRLEMKKIRLEAKKAQAEKTGIWNTVKVRSCLRVMQLRLFSGLRGWPFPADSSFRSRD